MAVELGVLKGDMILPATIVQTRDNFSKIVRQLESDELPEHYVMNRNRSVAKIVPVELPCDVSKRIGGMKDKRNDFDYESSQALNAATCQVIRAIASSKRSW